MKPTRLPTLPQHPIPLLYYTVAFSSWRREDDSDYDDMSSEMETLALQSPGCHDLKSMRDSRGLSITHSFWKDEESIRRWKNNVRHLEAQRKGRALWYESYRIRVARVERDYRFPESLKAPSCT